MVVDGRRWKVDGRPEACFTGSFILFVVRKRILPRRAVKDPAAFVAGYRKTNLICPGTGGSKRQRITLKSKKTRRILQRKAKQVQRCKREWSRKERDVRRVRQDFARALLPFRLANSTSHRSSREEPIRPFVYRARRNESVSLKIRAKGFGAGRNIGM